MEKLKQQAQEEAQEEAQKKHEDLDTRLRSKLGEVYVGKFFCATKSSKTTGNRWVRSPVELTVSFQWDKKGLHIFACDRKETVIAEMSDWVSHYFDSVAVAPMETDECKNVKMMRCTEKGLIVFFKDDTRMIVSREITIESSHTRSSHCG